MLVATLSRPPVNALDDELIAALDAVLDAADAPTTAIAVLHLRSELHVFCAGADLALIRLASRRRRAATRWPTSCAACSALFARLEAAPLATLAEIGGAALGGGLRAGARLRPARRRARGAARPARGGARPAGRRRRHAAAHAAVRARRGQAPDPRRRRVDGAQAERSGIVQWARAARRTRALARALAAALRRAYPRPRWPRTSAASRCPATPRATASPTRSPQTRRCTNTRKPGARCRPTSWPGAADPHATKEKS